MKNIRQVFTDIPVHETAMVKYQGKLYMADEISIRWIMLKVAEKKVDPRDFVFYDCDDNGKWFPIRFSKENNGRFNRDFTGNVMYCSPQLSIAMLRIERQKRKQ
jgi:hypothetical protein